MQNSAEARVRIDYFLYAANGATIPTYGWVSRSLSLGLCRDLTWHFIVTEVELPIIGVDFLSHISLLVDFRTTVFSIKSTPKSRKVTPRHRQSPASVIASDSILDNFLSEFPALTNPTGIHREVQHNKTDHTRPPSSMPSTPPCSRPLGGGQGGVRCNAVGRYS